MEIVIYAERDEDEVMISGVLNEVAKEIMKRPEGQIDGLNARYTTHRQG